MCEISKTYFLRSKKYCVKNFSSFLPRQLITVFTYLKTNLVPKEQLVSQLQAKKRSIIIKCFNSFIGSGVQLEVKGRGQICGPSHSLLISMKLAPGI